MTGRFRRLGCMVAIVAGVAGCASGGLSTPAFAQACPSGSVYGSCAPGWALTAHTFPTTIAPGGEGEIIVDVMNVGAASSNGSVTVTDTLPRGVTAMEAGDLAGPRYPPPSEFKHALWSCTIALGNEENSVVACVNNQENMPSLTGGGGNPNTVNGPNRDPMIGIAVKAPARDVAEQNRVSVAGGGAPSTASVEDPIAVGTDPGDLRFANWDAWFSNADGTVDTQAGSHPYEATFSFDLASEYNEDQLGIYPLGGNAREIDVELPAGFVGNPTVVPQCTREQLDEKECPKASQVGIIAVTVVLGINFHASVYNIVPPVGVADQIGFEIEGIETLINTGVRTGSDYGLTSHAPNTPERAVTGAVLTLWGEPGDSSHNPWRQPQVNGISEGAGGGCGEAATNELCLSPGTGPPFLTLPTQCSGPVPFSIRSNTWEHPQTWTETVTTLSHDSNHEPVGFTGCEHLGFGPSISALPDTAKADTPAGLTVEVKPPVGGLTTPEGLSTSDIEDTTVTLPEGVVVNPGQAAGLQACQETPEQSGIGTENAAACPLASKVGTVKIRTPLLEGSAEKELEGDVYILQSNPPQLHLLVAVSGDGVNLKLVGIVRLDERTGRLTTTFGEQPEVEAQDPFLKGHLRLPQLPFTDFRLSFSGGAQAALATPTQCGTYATSSDFGPWAAPYLADLLSEEARFAITEGANGAPCPSNPLPFTPSLIAGSTTDQAGGFTDFSLLLQAPDDQQRIEHLQFKVPEGLLGMISQVPLCGEPQAQDGTCSSASQIGHTVVASGPGPYPLVVPQPGQPPAAIYLTGSYKGAPYGLSIVVPVHVGPFVLQTQIVRAKIEVDPLTAQITVTTDPFPQVIDGIPTDLRTINAVVDRPGFMFNPTNCNPMSFSGTAYSAQGASAPISSRFQMGSCRALLFKPNFKVSTSGKTSRKNGASLDAKIVYPRGALGANQASSQSNLKSVKVDLPKQLPSRLTTLQKACTSQVFEANPANCPADSRVGTASAITPVLPVELTGPAYFVSYGGAKFPELVFALQGYGVTIYVHGETFINKAGITSSTFHQVPDVPIYQFELKLPEGPFSALAANGHLCNTKLKMPTSFTAQDGAVIHQSTPISVTGCAKAKAKAKGKSGKKARSGKKAHARGKTKKK
jgi:hypothetical protein